MDAINVKDLVKEYRNFTLGNLNVTIPSGYIVGLIGENGAGKTTFIKCLLEIIKPTKGTIKLLGQDIKDAKEDIGVVLDDMFFPEILQVKDISAVMKGIYQKWDEELFFKYLKDFNLDPNKIIKTLSKGMHKKLEIATALAHHPKLLILDEPTEGLDSVVRSEVLDIFLNFIQDEEHSVLLSTHITSDLEHIADRIIFIADGKILMEKDRDELLDNYGILKVNVDEIDKIAKEDIIACLKHRYDYEILVSEKDKISKKYPNYIVDKITLEELMVLMIKGERQC